MATDTKERILETALELFAQSGYLGTSMNDIARQLGITKAALYKHYTSKQEILDTLVKQVLQQYENHSIFARANWEEDAANLPLTADAAVQMIQGQLRYILHDATIQRARKMLVIAQFQNSELAALQTKQNYTDVLGYFTGLVQCLIRKGVLSDHDPQIMAAQLCLPISVWLSLCDREPEREKEVMALVEKHIRQFFRIYQPDHRR